MVIAPLIIDLGLIVTFLVAFALCLLAGQLVRALFQVADSALGWIPWLGSKITGDLHRIEQRIAASLGSAALSLEKRIGAMYHSAARLVDQIGETIVGAFELIYALTGVVASLPTWRGVTALYHSLVGQEKATVSTVREHGKAIARTQKVTQAQTKVITQTLVRTQAIPADVVVPGDLAGLRGRARAAEDQIARLWDRVRGLALPSVRTIAIGAVAVALGRLGLTWARCSKVNRVGKRLCGMDDSLLDSLLEDTLLILGTISVVEFARELGSITDIAASAVHGLIRES